MMSTVILRTGSRLIVPLSLVFAVYVYFKGHQTPGGGFVAGLVASVALIVHRMAEGGGSLQRMLPCSERTLIAIGLSLALLTGAAALLWDLPFFTSNHGYLPLPGNASAAADGTTLQPEYTEWATVMFFDLGVFLTVAGVVVGMIDALSRELE